MHVSPPRRIERIAASMDARVVALVRVGGTTSVAWVSKLTTATLSPSRMRSTMPTAAAIAFEMRSPFIEPERSITMARFNGGALTPAGALPVTDAKKYMAQLEMKSPASSYAKVKIMGKEFDPSQPEKYLASFAVRKDV